jgi:hypothetical protein
LFGNGGVARKEPETGLETPWDGASFAVSPSSTLRVGCFRWTGSGSVSDQPVSEASGDIREKEYILAREWLETEMQPLGTLMMLMVVLVLYEKSRKSP